MLRADGFKGSVRNYRRVVGEFIHTVNIQGSRYGGQFAVNLGIHPLVLPDVLGNAPDPRKMVEPLCEFRGRLTPSGADHWWAHGTDRASMDQAVRDAAALFQREGRARFDRWSGPESPLHTLTPSTLPEFHFRDFHSSLIRIAFVMARLRRAQGRRGECAGFAVYALDLIGEGTGGSSLRAELEEMLAWARGRDRCTRAE
jgi:hypothetical protein